MNLLDRLQLLIKAVMHDLWSDSLQTAVDGPTTTQQEAVLVEARAQAAAMGAELAEAVARDKRLEMEWQQAQAQAGAASRAVDQALQSGQDEQARAYLQESKRLDAEAARKQRRYEESSALTVKMLRVLMEYDEHLAVLNRQMEDLIEKERGAARLEEIEGLRRSIRREMTVIQSSLALRREMAARREDKLSARGELDERLQKRDG